MHEALYTPTVLVLAGAFGAVVWRRGSSRSRAGWPSPPVWRCSPSVTPSTPAPMDTDIGSTGLSWADPLYLIGSMVLVVGALRLKSATSGRATARR